MGKLMKASNLNRAASMVHQHLELDIHVSWPCLIRAGILLFSAAQRFMTSMPRKFFLLVPKAWGGKAAWASFKVWYYSNYLPPVSTTTAVQAAKFDAGVIDGAPWLANLSADFCEKIWKDPNVIFKGLGEDDSWKKPEAKYLVTLSL